MRTNLAEFDHRFDHALHTLNLRVPPAERRGRFLDIGCGTGNAVAAAAKLGFDEAIGVDINLRCFKWYEPTEFPELCRSHGADPARARLIEADIFNVDLAPDSFDTIVMLDSIEHVPTPERFIARGAELLAPDGKFIIDCGALYYSWVGHHLWHWFPRETLPWVHLRHDFLERAKAAKIDDWSWREFEVLNKVTHQAIRDALVGSGLTVIEERRGAPSAEDLAVLEHHRPALDLTGIDERWLFEDWILIIAQKPPSI
jgi:SAM-dependent methyltransferase